MSAQAPATLSGRVVADNTEEPLVNARIAVPTATGISVVLTDASGRFSLPVPPDVKSIAVSKPGYGTADIPVGSLEPVVVRLVRGAAISGRVVDDFGDPFSGARVAIAKPSTDPDGSPSIKVASTDDRGEYRLSSLQPGRYVVAVHTVGNSAFDPQARPFISYYPGVPTADKAQEFALDPGDDRPVIDFVVPAPGIPLPVMLIRRQAAEPRSPDSGATGTMRGQVVSTDGRGVRHAQVRLIAQSGPLHARAARADEEGRFEFLDLDPDTYRIAVTKQGYSTLEPQSTPFVIAGGETRERIVARMRRWATVSGRVFDELGEPIEGASVQMLQVRYESGSRRLVPIAGAAWLTDDLGRYRLSASAPPGRYIISATLGAMPLGSPFSMDVPGYARAYYPATPNPGEAQFIALGVGSDISGIDVSLSRTTTARVIGTVINAAGESSIGGSLTLVPSVQSGSVTSIPVGARILPSGQFEFLNVTPGQYVIRSDRGRANRSNEGEFGTLPVTVNGSDVSGLIVHTSRGSSISGRFTFETYHDSKAPSPRAVELSPVPTDPDRSPASIASSEVKDDWTFEMTGINGPRRLELVQTPADWALKEIRVNGVDIGDRPLSFGSDRESLNDVEVVLTDRVNVIMGRVSDDRGRPVSAPVLVFAADRDRRYPNARYFRRQSASADGTFSIAGLPAGSYYVIAAAALPGNGDDSWQESAYLDTLVSRATSVVLGDDQKISLSLKPVR